ncbi:DUF2024 family protein [Pseudomonas sp. T8]|uniref:DUF2024 family protein n=1 Tax=Pseudomonas sp. T8 TaxID=645292 RepID=UPI0021496A9C|nr:DUF2024 family protein [Pseudomonas sp. T8]UUT22919.1 DUF2024 family protein [Pseudomonas sp. T8]
MKVNVFDTHVRTRDGRYLHFDVLIEGNDETRAKQYASEWMIHRGIQDADIELSRCQFCHSEPANPEVAAAIVSQGYFIIKLQGC